MPAFVRSLDVIWDGQIWEDPQQKVKVAFLATEMPGDSQIELVAPVGIHSPVYSFLERGGGLHHVCYEVEDLALQINAMRSRGALLARPPKPAVAFAGRRIAWVITAEKLLVELLERSLPN